MSHTIHDAISETAARVEKFNAIAARFSDAYQRQLADGSYVWTSCHVKATAFSLHVSDDSRRSIQIHFYEEVAGVRVYTTVSRHADTCIEGMEPMLRAVLIATMLGEKPK